MALWNNPITRGVAAGGLRTVAAGLDLVGADRSAQGTYRQASNITNPNVGMNAGITLSNGFPMVTEFQRYGGLPPTSQTGTKTAQGGGGEGYVLGDDTVRPTSTGSATNDGSVAARQAAADAQERAALLFGIDSQLSSANDGLGRLDNQLNTGLGNISREYQSAYQRLTGQRQKGERDYTQNRTNQLNEYLANRNKVATEARGWMDSARRTLGTQGAGGGSAARYAVPYEAQGMVAAGNSQAQAVNNRNITSLDQAWADDRDELTNAERDLQYQRDTGERDYRSKIEQQRAELLAQVGQLQGQRRIAEGGDFRAAQAAAAPYTSRIQGILNSIDGLAATPSIRERAVTLDRPDLSGYNWAQPEAPAAPVQDPTLGGGMMPLGQQQEEQRNPLLALFGLDDRTQYA